MYYGFIRSFLKASMVPFLQVTSLMLTTSKMIPKVVRIMGPHMWLQKHNFDVSHGVNIALYLTSCFAHNQRMRIRQTPTWNKHCDHCCGDKEGLSLLQSLHLDGACCSLQGCPLEFGLDSETELRFLCRSLTYMTFI